MQDAVQYGAVEASSPPTPPKRFGRKTVVALAALGLAGVAALSLGPQKKTATGLVVSPGRPLCLKPGQAWNGWTGTSTQVLHVSQLQPQFADWRGSGKVPAIMRGQRHQLTFRERMLPVRPGLDRRNPQQRRHPALKSGSPATIDFSVRSLPRRAALIVYIILTSLSYERVASIVEVGLVGLC